MLHAGPGLLRGPLQNSPWGLEPGPLRSEAALWGGGVLRWEEWPWARGAPGREPEVCQGG